MKGNEVEGLARAVEKAANLCIGGHGGRKPRWHPLALPVSIPRIVCLCGSGRFQQAFQEAFLRLELAGCIVLSIGADAIAAGVTPQQKADLDELHLRKIDLADCILVLNVGGYVGSSTAAEIAYARQKGKPVVFLEEEGPDAAA